MPAPEPSWSQRSRGKPDPVALPIFGTIARCTWEQACRGRCLSDYYTLCALNREPNVSERHDKHAHLLLMKTNLVGYTSDTLEIGDHAIYDVKKIEGLDCLPEGVQGKHLLVKKLQEAPILAAEVCVGQRDFYLCYAIKQSFIFIVEVERVDKVVSRYRPQYGANDNYDTYNQPVCFVKIYTPESGRTRPEVSWRLSEYL